MGHTEDIGYKFLIWSYNLLPLDIYNGPSQVRRKNPLVHTELKSATKNKVHFLLLSMPYINFKRMRYEIIIVKIAKIQWAYFNICFIIA